MLTTVRLKEREKTLKTLNQNHWSNKTIFEEQNQTQLIRLSRALLKNNHNMSRGMKKWLYSMKTLCLTLLNSVKPTWKRSNEYPISSAIFPRYYIVRLLFVPFDGTWSCWSAVPLISSHHKMASFVYNLKRRALLPSRYSSSARTVGNGCS